MEPADIIDRLAVPDTAERGLYFICFNASIARQFEFVQQTWINNPKFGGLYADNDPITGQRVRATPEHASVETDNFTVQGTPLGRRYRSLPEFVRVRGGAYFFMPGMEALKYLAGKSDYKLPLSRAEELGNSDDSQGG
jgi:deferrochelatase/peroxidase EfeB